MPRRQFRHSAKSSGISRPIENSAAGPSTWFRPKNDLLIRLQTKVLVSFNTRRGYCCILNAALNPIDPIPFAMLNLHLRVSTGSQTVYPTDAYNRVPQEEGESCSVSLNFARLDLPAQRPLW